jgi:TFIIF-interacting CTD phosphatase-like protein
LILDLDETIVFSEERVTTPKTAPDFVIKGDRGETFYVSKRPGLTVFLDYAFRNFDVAIWSASTESYIQPILENILSKGQKPKFVWDRSKVTSRKEPESLNYVFLKRLKKVFDSMSWQKEKILIVDDTSETALDNYGNYIPCPPYYGDPRDTVLVMLERYLESIKDKPNFREIDKRNWMEKLDVEPEGEPI